MNAKDVDFFEKVKAQLHQMHNEVSVLSKTKADNLINKFKLGFINEKLGEANTILTGGFKPFKDFALFNVDELPTNSDVVIVLSQYLDCWEAWRCPNIQYDRWEFECYWIMAAKKKKKTEPQSR